MKALIAFTLVTLVFIVSLLWALKWATERDTVRTRWIDNCVVEYASEYKDPRGVCESRWRLEHSRE